MHPKLTAVSSSNIAGFGYNPASKDLVVAFHNGSYYLYSEVAQDIVLAFEAAPSKGAFLNVVIKQDMYAYREIAEQEVDVLLSPEEAAHAVPRIVLGLEEVANLVVRYPFLRLAF